MNVILYIKTYVLEYLTTEISTNKIEGCWVLIIFYHSINIRHCCCCSCFSHSACIGCQPEKTTLQVAPVAQRYHVTSDTLGREFDPGKRDFSH